MLNSYIEKPTLPLESMTRLRAEEDDVAASIRERFRQNISKILDDLRDRGVKQKDIAGAFGKEPAALSHLKNGKWFPSAEEMDRLLETLNKFRDELKQPQLDHEDLFRNPKSAASNFIEELARRAGYEIVKKT